MEVLMTIPISVVTILGMVLGQNLHNPSIDNKVVKQLIPGWACDWKFQPAYRKYWSYSLKGVDARLRHQGQAMRWGKQKKKKKGFPP